MKWGLYVQWSFELSLMAFLLIILLSQWVSTATASRLSLPFVMGVLCMVGFASGLLPADFVEQSKLIPVGFIAFNVLVIHSGAGIRFGELWQHRQTVVITLAGVTIMTLVLVFGLTPVIGRELALLSPGPIVGGGATAAIASNWVRMKAPQLSFYPWMAFMLQTFFGLPLVTWAIKKEARRLLWEYRAHPLGVKDDPSTSRPHTLHSTPRTLVGRIPEQYKCTAYYLGTLMVVAVLNKWLNATVLAGLNININVTALLLGMLLGQLGLLERNPLFKSDAFGLLLLGLMSLMGNTLSKTPLPGILAMTLPLLLAFAVATVVLVITGLVAARICKFSPYRGILMMANCMLSFPPGVALAGELLDKEGTTDPERGMLKHNLLPVLSIGSGLVVNVASIFIASLLVSLV